MKKIGLLLTKEALLYLAQNGIDIKIGSLLYQLGHNEIFLKDKDTKFISRYESYSHGGRGFWLISFVALDNYIEYRRTSEEIKAAMSVIKKHMIKIQPDKDKTGS